MATRSRWLPVSEAFAPTRICTKCGVERPIEEFRPHVRYRGGRKRICRFCERPLWRRYNNSPRRKQKIREDRASGKLRISERRKKLRNKFGMSLEDYDAMLAAQNGRCAICGGEPDHTSRNPQRAYLHVDHNHTTGKVRALLCAACNHGIGHFRESPDIMEKAIAYLRVHQQSEV